MATQTIALTTPPFSVPALPYDYAALEPHIDARTMEIHDTKDHETYVKNLHAALDTAPELRHLSLEELLAKLDAVPESIRRFATTAVGTGTTLSSGS